MSMENINSWVKRIQVKNMVNADVEVINKSPLKMIGKGRQGAVFQITDDICLKVFGNTEDCDREYYALSLGQHTNLLPRVYAKGPLYIAMEMIKGVDLREYLQSQPLTEEISYKLIEMLITFKNIGYERIDHHKRQIYLQEDGSLKVIDVARTIWRDRVYPYPRKLLTSLGEENKQVFLSHVQQMAPQLYEEWQHYIRMEEMSRQISQVLFSKKSDSKALKALSENLLTTNDERKYAAQLEGLVRKVFKEEWVKTMLAQGKDPEQVMQKIDEYMEMKENQYLRGSLLTRDSNRKDDKHDRYDKEERYRKHDRNDKEERYRKHDRNDKEERHRKHDRYDREERHGKKHGYDRKDKHHD